MKILSRHIALITLLALVAIQPRSHAQTDNEPIVIGNYRTISSEVLGEERLLYVHLPEGYEESDQRYPVVFQLYAHFQGAYFLPQVRALDAMAKHGRCPQMILVGIETNETRYRDLLLVDHFGATSEIDRFMEFFESELVPFVESNYRTENYRILSGPQAGAAFGVYTLCKAPKLFNALLLSNPFWIAAARVPLSELFDSATEQGLQGNHTMVISYTEDESAEARMAVEDFGERVIGAKPDGLDFVLNPLPAGFDYSVSVDFETGARHIFDGFELPKDGDPISIGEVKARYSKLQTKLGIPLKPAELGLVYQGDKYVKRGDIERAEEMFLYVITLYPESLMSFVRLGDIAAERGEKEVALEYYERFRKLLPDSPYILSKIEALSAE